MATVELKVPELGESVAEVFIASWLKGEGDRVREGEALVEIESEKATLEIPAPVTGRLIRIGKQAGDSARVGEVIGAVEAEESAESEDAGVQAAGAGEPSPAAADAAAPSPSRELGADETEQDVRPMTPIRWRIAQRLVEAQKTAALLTTFNEIDMTRVTELRQTYGSTFREKYGVKLGLMSFFVKASVEALKQFPELNAEVRGRDVVYHRAYHIGIAVGSERGLTVPVLRHADRLSFAQIEQAIRTLARRADEGTLAVEDMLGGTFTISNGGVYGSLLSTPIVNPPQTAILGMHSIQERPVVREGRVVVRPMMYVALTYDHRVVDGREAVTFLRRIKELVEDPCRLLLGL